MTCSGAVEPCLATRRTIHRDPASWTRTTESGVYAAHEPTRHLAADKGAAAVEFALIFPLLLLLIFGMIDFGRGYSMQVAVTQAAREVVRNVSLGSFATPASCGGGSIQTYAVCAAQYAEPQVPPGAVSVSVTACPTTGTQPTDQAVVRVSNSFSFITPIGAIVSLIGGALSGPVVISSTAVQRCETP